MAAEAKGAEPNPSVEDEQLRADERLLAEERLLEQRADPTAKLRDVLVLLLLTVTAVVTAWCGFEASKWGGAMSIAFSQASSARIEAARDQGSANNYRQIDVNLWTIYVQAVAENKPQLAKYVSDRFPDRLQTAFEAWKDGGRTAASPFDLKAYQPPGQAEATKADQRADQRFDDALEYNARGDHYTVLTVLFALVLLFAAISPRPSRPLFQWILLGFGLVAFVVGVVVMLQLPVLVG